MWIFYGVSCILHCHSELAVTDMSSNCLGTHHNGRYIRSVLYDINANIVHFVLQNVIIICIMPIIMKNIRA